MITPMYDFLDDRKEIPHVSLRSLPQSHYEIPPLVHQWTYPNGRIGGPLFGKNTASAM